MHTAYSVPRLWPEQCNRAHVVHAEDIPSCEGSVMCHVDLQLTSFSAMAVPHSASERQHCVVSRIQYIHVLSQYNKIAIEEGGNFKPYQAAV